MPLLKKPPKNPLIIFTTRRLGEKKEDLFKNCDKPSISSPPLKNLDAYWNEYTSSKKTNHAEIRKIQGENIFGYLHLPYGAISIKNAAPFIKALYDDASILSNYSPNNPIDAIYLILHGGDIAMRNAYFSFLPKKRKKELHELLKISNDTFFEVIAFMHEPQSPIFRLLSEYKEKDKKAITLVQKIEAEKYKKNCENFRRKLSPKLRSLSIKKLGLNEAEKKKWEEMYNPFVFETNKVAKNCWDKTNKLFQEGNFSLEDFRSHLDELIKSII